MAIYCDNSDLPLYGIPAAWLASVSSDEKTAARTYVSRRLEAILRSRGYVMPLTDWGEDVRGLVAEMTVLHLWKVKGTDPENTQFATRTIEIENRLKMIANGSEVPEMKDSSVKDEDEKMALTVSSDTQRGW